MNTQTVSAFLRSFFSCLLLVVLFLLSGCSRDVMVSTVLEDTAGLRPGDRVYLDSGEVGVVDSIEATEQTPGFTVDFGLYPQNAELIQKNAVAYVPPEGPPMLVLLNPSEPAAPVAPGGRLKGLSPLELAIWQVSDAAGRASSLMEALALRIDNYFESEEWEKARADIDDEISGLAASSRATAEHVAEELQVLIESLTETVAGSANELSEELTRIEEEIATLEMQGHEELAGSLRGLLERIEMMTRPEPDRESPDTPTPLPE
jgi:ABC-type transporter Mla subunit MlaD